MAYALRADALDDGRSWLMRILFVHNNLSRFVRIDRDLLAERYLVSEQYERSPRHLHPIDLWRRVANHDVVFCWFASWHSFLPVLFARKQGKPSVVVIGGYDVARMADIGYGHQRGGLKKWVSRSIMQSATRLVTNAYYSQQEAEQNAGIRKERVHVVYHGIADLFGPLSEGHRAPMVLTVGNVDRSNLWRKGHEPFVRAAALLPDVEFILVGAWKDDAINHLRAIAPSNVTFTGRVDDEALAAYYRRAHVYVQASQHEGFGLSVAESMLAGCIPVVTRAGSLPEVVGDTGVYAGSTQPADLASAIRRGLALGRDASERARARILAEFPLDRRRQALQDTIERLLRRTPPR